MSVLQAMSKGWKAMDENEKIEPPPIAEMPKHLVPEGAQAASPPVDEEVDAIAKATAIVANYRRNTRDKEIEVTELALAIEGRNQRIAQLELDLAEIRNNLQTVAAQLEEKRQEASDLQALFSSFKAQLENFEIPLPIRKKAGNGNNHKKIKP
jgi:chromosome segregation ATPase